MTSKTVLCSILAASFLTTPVALTQGDATGANRNRYEQNQRNIDRDRRGDARPNNNRYNNNYTSEGGSRNQQGDYQRN